jgi:hypothetical protein
MTIIQVQLSRQQMKALRACARARGQSFDAVLAAAVAKFLSPYRSKIEDDTRAAAAHEKTDGGIEPIPNDLTADYLEDQLLRRLAGLPPAPPE